MAGAALLGLDRNAVIQKRFGQFVAMENRPAFADFCKRVLTTDTKQTCEVKLLKDGQPVYALVEGIAAQDHQGQGRLCRAAVIDITERKRAEQELVEGRQRLAGIVGSAMDAIISVDAAHRIVLFNAAAEKMFRCPAAEAIGQPLDRFIPERFRAAHAGHVKAFGEAGTTSRAMGQLTSLSALRADGEEFPMEASISQGEVRGQKVFTVILRDITDRKQAEQVTADARLSAEQAKAVAERANRAKDHFLAVLSHELRTPLTPVVLAASMLQRRPDLDPEMREMLEMVGRSVEMEARLIDDLLDVARIARGKIELNRRPIDLCTVIQSAVEVCKPDIEARRLDFGVDLGQGEPYWVEADMPRLQQVFWNLLRNAVKFTLPGGRVGIRCRRDGTHVVIEVNDSGMGIDPESLFRVFDAFDQVEQSITRQFGGLGLGLAISKALVEMHGGTISAHSEGRDKGATFRIRLPLTAPISRPEAPAPAASPQQAVRPLHVLLVEDHGVTAKMMRWVLMSDGHEVETAGDVATGLELASQHSFDLLISDLGLPDGSGHDLMRNCVRADTLFLASR